MRRQLVANPACEERLARLVRERTGVRILDHQLANLRRTVADACETFDYADCLAYLAALQASPADSPLHEHLIAGITVGESYFFRDQAQMEFLQWEFLPRLIEQRRASGDRSLRVWSAGCSDGQELYSIAMLLHELLPDLERWNIHLLGTDINVTALSRAIRGGYREWSFRATSEVRRRRYFQADEGLWRLMPELRQRARFSYLNLHGDQFPSVLSETNAIDLILCRNVFIYFDPATVLPVMRKLHASLAPGGCLLLGASDLVDATAIGGFEFHPLGQMYYLLKSGEEVCAQRAPSTHWSAAAIPASTRVETLPSLEAPPAAKRSHGELLAPYGEIIDLLSTESWQLALSRIDERIATGEDSAMIWQFQAKALANRGQTRLALEACRKSLEKDATDKHTYFIQALVLAEAGRLKAAEESLRATLYLDRRFVEAHYQLGLLLIRRGEEEAGLKSMRIALRIAEEASPDRRLHDAAGMDYGRMAAILRNELLIYGGGRGA